MPNLRKKNFVIFYSPGTLFAETSTRELDGDWDPVRAVQLAKAVVERYNSQPYGFVFETRIVADDVDDGAGGKLRVEQKTIEKSGTHFLSGRLELYDDLIARDSEDEKICRDNMRFNGWWIVCVTSSPWRSTHPFELADRVVDKDGKVVERGDDPRHVEYRRRCAERFAL